MTFRNATRWGRVLRCLAAAGLVAGATTAVAVSLPGSAMASSPHFAPASTAAIHPGVMLQNPSGQCTANFIYTSGSKVYIGQAAHCTGKGSPNETDGCTSKSDPLGTKVEIEGANHPGRLVYNSWLTMRSRHEKDQNLCAFNDFALVEIDPDDVSKVNPTVPTFGGPTGLRTRGLADGEGIYSYGNSKLRLGLTALSPKKGISLGDGGDGRTHLVFTVTAGIPGDSGSGYLDSDGRAFGVLSTLNLAPAPGTNGVSDLAKALKYANNYGEIGEIHLEKGTEPFSAGFLPVDGLASHHESPHYEKSSGRRGY
ncbi:MAG: serine protease [Pseudonocardia sp.]|nr:serine protease [Pseudonocardia sp.]